MHSRVHRKQDLSARASGIRRSCPLQHVTISDFGQFLRLLGPAPKSLGLSAFFGGIIGVSVQGFFTYRIYAFTKTLYIPMISWCMAFVRLLGNTAYFVAELQMTSVPVYVEQWGWLLTTVCTVPLVDKLVMWTIATGMLTRLSSLATHFVHSFDILPRQYHDDRRDDLLIWLGVYLIVPGRKAMSIDEKLWLNMVFDLNDSLNSREQLRAMNDSLPISTLNFAAGLSSGPKSSVG
ncbi:hypothetical protein B0H14DRAFT_2587865 [Mycena olivaceomarginata]|nr:hypothetical protein B0H14DRAFT_2587865 [Mycena olivaceomarginata]